MKRLTILVVDDDPSIGKLFQDLVTQKMPGVEVVFTKGTEALKMLETNGYDIAFVDVKMPDIDGFKVLEQAKAFRPELEVIMFTGQAKIEDAVKAVKMGASDYVEKPFKVAQVILALERVAKVKSLKNENEILKKELQGRYKVANIVGITPQMEQVMEFIDRVRNEDSNVLVGGESGTGKELVARAIHYEGKRKDKPFFPIDCASIHKSLLESELFGHERGSFTGAYNKKMGLFEKAKGGTIFLDEVAEVPIELQGSLLRTIEEKKIRPVGSTNSVNIDVRIIAATNKDLEGAVEVGLFRRDLYYRLNVVAIRVPSLRERKDDVPLIADHFTRILNEDGKHRNVRGISKDALFVLLRYDWPGNVRELENTIEYAIELGKSEMIEVSDLPVKIVNFVGEKSSTPSSVPSVGNTSLKELTTDIIVKTLIEYEGNTANTANRLGIDRSTIYRRLARSKISVSELKNGYISGTSSAKR